MNSLSIATKTLKALETSSSLGMFAKDTGGCLLSRLSLSRSKEESKEIKFTEIAESAIFYFIAPFLAKTTGDIFSKHENKQVGRFAQIITTFSLALPLIFAIAPIRNQITYNNTNKDKFTSVIGLENENKKSENEKKDTKKLIKKLSLISALGVGAGVGSYFFSKKPNNYKKIEPFVNKTVEKLGFNEKNDLSLSHYAALVYPVSVASYFYSSRDKYEKLENLRRFSITIPLMFLGEKLIENPIYRAFDKIFKTNVIEVNKVKTYKEILNFPKNQQKQMLKSKNFAYGTTFLINTVLIGLGVALLNRIATKENYKRDKEDIIAR